MGKPGKNKLDELFRIGLQEAEKHISFCKKAWLSLKELLDKHLKNGMHGFLL